MEYFVFYKSAIVNEWLVERAYDVAGALDTFNDLRESATDAFVAVRHFDGSMSALTSDELETAIDG